MIVVVVIIVLDIVCCCPIAYAAFKKCFLVPSETLESQQKSQKYKKATTNSCAYKHIAKRQQHQHQKKF